MTDLKDRGLLETTLIVWMGEFGRTPKFGRPDGRDHWPNSFSAVLAGGGIKGGQVIGDSGPDGATIKERPVSVPEFLATIWEAPGIDHQKQNVSNVGRPIRIVAPGHPGCAGSPVVSCRRSGGMDLWIIRSRAGKG
jgi:hypothetical protein